MIFSKWIYFIFVQNAKNYVPYFQTFLKINTANTNLHVLLNLGFFFFQHKNVWFSLATRYFEFSISRHVATTTNANDTANKKNYVISFDVYLRRSSSSRQSPQEQRPSRITNVWQTRETFCGFLLDSWNIWQVSFVCAPHILHSGCCESFSCVFKLSFCLCSEWNLFIRTPSHTQHLLKWLWIVNLFSCQDIAGAWNDVCLCEAPLRCNVHVELKNKHRWN